MKNGRSDHLLRNICPVVVSSHCLVNLLCEFHQNHLVIFRISKDELIQSRLTIVTSIEEATYTKEEKGAWDHCLHNNSEPLSISFSDTKVFLESTLCCVIIVYVKTYE